jgi:hypothetical protein
MAILRERKVWTRPKPVRTTAVPDDLTPEECERVRAALAFLRAKHGSWRALALAMGIKPDTLEEAAKRRGRRPTAGLALRAARVAGVCVETVLSGAWPAAGACPHCGR